MYDIKVLPRCGWILHAPCRIGDITEDDHEVRFTLAGWGGLRRQAPYHVLIAGMPQPPHQVLHYRKVNGQWDWQELDPQCIQRSQSPTASLTLRLEGPADIRIRTGP